MKKELKNNLLPNKQNDNKVVYRHIVTCGLFTFTNLILSLLSNSFCSFSECLNSINMIIQLSIYNISKEEGLKKITLY